MFAFLQYWGLNLEFNWIFNMRLLNFFNFEVLLDTVLYWLVLFLLVTLDFSLNLAESLVKLIEERVFHKEDWV